jgi:hypothetical protein
MSYWERPQPIQTVKPLPKPEIPTVLQCVFLSQSGVDFLVQKNLDEPVHNSWMGVPPIFLVGALWLIGKMDDYHFHHRLRPVIPQSDTRSVNVHFRDIEILGHILFIRPVDGTKSIEEIALEAMRS